MPGQSGATIIGGPCLITYRGATLRSKGNVRMSVALDLFPVDTSLLGQVDVRVREQPRVLSFEPDGEWSNLGILWPYGNYPIGTFITPQLVFGAIAANQVNIGSTATLISGDAAVVQVQGSGTITNGLVAGTLYYVHVQSATNISLHTTYANAVAGVNPVGISAGTGNTMAMVNNPLTIQSQDNNGQLWTFFNAAISRMPDIFLSSVRTAVGPIEFNSYLADGQDWSGASSVYSLVSNPWPGDPTFNPQNILTGEVSSQWGRGSVAPWSAFDTKTGWDIRFALELTRVEADNVGLITHRLSNIVATARAQPLGVMVQDVMNLMYIQGSNAARGRSLAAFGNDLLISAVAGNLGVKLTNAGLRGGPFNFDNKLDRVGELEWMATRTFNATGTNPLFVVSGTSVT